MEVDWCLFLLNGQTNAKSEVRKSGSQLNSSKLTSSGFYLRPYLPFDCRLMSGHSPALCLRLSVENRLESFLSQSLAQ